LGLQPVIHGAACGESVMQTLTTVMIRNTETSIYVLQLYTKIWE